MSTPRHLQDTTVNNDKVYIISQFLAYFQIDLVEIKEMFLTQYGMTLGDYIKDDTSGAYRDLLLRIVDGEN